MKSLILILMAVSLMSGNLSAQMEQDFYLEDHRWNDRVLLIFSPNNTYTDLTTTLHMIQENMKGFTERDVKVFQVLSNIGSASGDNVLNRNDAKKLRERFDIDPSSFMVILIGKDGSEKLRSGETITQEKLFEVIDAMPMRRLEMKEDG